MLSPLTHTHTHAQKFARNKGALAEGRQIRNTDTEEESKGEKRSRAANMVDDKGQSPFLAASAKKKRKEKQQKQAWNC